MIRIFLGNVGSGKTISAVREMWQNLDGLKTYTNIHPKFDNPNIVVIKPEMIIKKTHVRDIKRKSGDIDPVYEYKLNQEYWQNIKEPINIILDEAHTLIDARRFMSKTNQVMNNWLAMIRRAIGGQGEGYGEITYITQLARRLDPVVRDMANNVRYHRCHFTKNCLDCGSRWNESSDSSEPHKFCPICQSIKIIRTNHSLEVWHFSSMHAYTGWTEFGMDTFHSHYIVNNIEKYFPMYDTLQWEDLFEGI